MGRLASLAPALPLVASFLAGIAMALALPCDPPSLGPAPDTVPPGPARRVAELIARGALRVPAPEPASPVYLALRDRGRRLADGWFSGPRWGHAVVRGMLELSAAEGASAATHLELCLPHGYRSQKLRSGRAVLGNIHRGVRGLELSREGAVVRHCPTEMLANNTSFGKLEERFRSDRELDAASYLATTRARVFDAHQVLVDLEAGESHPMFRGNRVIPLSEIDAARVERLGRDMGDWLLRQLHPDGRMTYKYWPSRGEEASSNNMIRQFMASVCLVRLAAFRDDATIAARAQQNLRYNFDRFYRQRGAHGTIHYAGKAKLGATALAALAIVEAPFRDELSQFESGLRNAIEGMQQPDGSFRTFFDSERNDNQNFYPGETLLLWATLYEKAPDPALLDRFMRAFRHYRGWHRENRNPAFIPWHTQAYFRVWQKTHDQELADFIFEMNDWLLDFQQWRGSRYPDTRGRFYDPDKDYGPPHASSTGVYLEGLIDAYRLARALSDERRAGAYRRAILRGLRSLAQLQFSDEVDMFYVHNRERVRGGLRTTVYDNTLRVDNVQHSLMAVMNIITTFGADGAW